MDTIAHVVFGTVLGWWLLLESVGVRFGGRIIDKGLSGHGHGGVGAVVILCSMFSTFGSTGRDSFVRVLVLVLAKIGSIGFFGTGWSWRFSWFRFHGGCSSSSMSRSGSSSRGGGRRSSFFGFRMLAIPFVDIRLGY